MCGIICYLTNPSCGIHVAGPIHTALTMLQHRGQGCLFAECSLADACGITTCNGEQIITVKDNGLVSEWAFSRGVRCRVFNQANLTKLKGYYGLGHVRYPTAGSPDRNESQPFYTNYPFARGSSSI